MHITRATSLLATAVVATGVVARMSGAAPTSTAIARPALGGYQVETIHDTNYVIPAGALFVANDGSDANPGSLAAPFATIHKALSVAPSGGTVVVRNGIYREGLGSFSRRVTLQAYPHETVWVKGSQTMSGFTHQGAAWIVSWTSPFCATCYPKAALDSKYPAAGLPEQVFINGAPLAQVTSRAALRPHTFFVDRKAHQLVLGDDPTGRNVEVTKLASAFSIGKAAVGSAVKGIGFEHWGTLYDGTPSAAVMISGANVTLDNDTFAWSSSRAVGVYGANDVITNSIFVDNGMTGVNAHMSDGLDFEHNEVAYANNEHWSIKPSPFAQTAGVKVTRTVNSVFRANSFHDSDSNGLWFDQLSARQVVVNNRIERNSGHGLAIEVSGWSIVAGNVVAENARDGMKLSGANDVAVYNNTVVDNGWAQIGVYEDPRHTTGLATSDTHNVALGNNVLMAGARSTKYVLYSFDLHHPAHVTTLQMIRADDNNVYGRTNATKPKYLASTQATATKMATFVDLNAFRNATHRERASTSADGFALTRLFVNPAQGNYSLVPGVPVAQPAAIPVAVAVAMGGSTKPSHVGA